MTGSNSDAPSFPEFSTFADLERGGLTHADIARLISTGDLIRYRHGVYARTGQVISTGQVASARTSTSTGADGSSGAGQNTGTQAEAVSGDGVPPYKRRENEFLARTRAAALSIQPGTVFSHGSALALHGLPLHGVPLELPTVTRHRPGGGSRRSTALTCSNLPLDGVVTEVDGVPVTSPARSVIDVARTVGLDSGVCAADAAIRMQLCTTTDLRREAEAARGRTGVARARQLPDLASGLAESVLESLLRLIIVLGGLPAPELQVGLGVRTGQRFRVDFYWRKWGLIGEADGFGKYGGSPEEIRKNWIAERHRQAQLEAEGYVVLRWTWEDIYRPGHVIRQVRAAMRQQERLGSVRAA